MFGVMKALIRNKYTGTIYPEHPRALDVDRDREGPAAASADIRAAAAIPESRTVSRTPGP